MSKNHIKNVAIVGAGGQVGKFIVEELLKTGEHKITAITREGSLSKMPSGVAIKTVNYDRPTTIVDALNGHDALMITIPANAPPDISATLIKAAAEAKVPWVLPNEFGGDSDNAALNADIPYGTPKAVDRKLIEDLGVSSWIGLACGFWYEFSLAGHEARFGFEFPERTVTLIDDGNTKIHTSTFPQCGRAVAKLLSLPIEGDGVTLSQYRNKFCRFASFTISQRDMLESVLRVTGTKESDWKITYENHRERFDRVKGDLVNPDGSMNYPAFGTMLYTRSFFPDGSADYAAGYGLDNENLGLPVEDLDEWTKKAIEMREDDYHFKQYGVRFNKKFQ